MPREFHTKKMEHNQQIRFVWYVVKMFLMFALVIGDLLVLGVEILILMGMTALEV